MNPDTLKDYLLAINELNLKFGKGFALQFEHQCYQFSNRSETYWKAYHIDYGWTGEYDTPMQAVGELLAKVR